MHWNAQGITNPETQLDLENFIREKQIDLISINETFLKPNHRFKLANYKVYREDRINHGGGVLIAIKNSIPHARLIKYPTLSIENISILIKINNKNIRFTSAYCPRFTPSFGNDLDKITETTHEFFYFW